MGSVSDLKLLLGLGDLLDCKLKSLDKYPSQPSAPGDSIIVLGLVINSKKLIELSVGFGGACDADPVVRSGAVRIRNSSLPKSSLEPSGGSLEVQRRLGDISA